MFGIEGATKDFRTQAGIANETLTQLAGQIVALLKQCEVILSKSSDNFGQATNEGVTHFQTLVSTIEMTLSSLNLSAKLVSSPTASFIQLMFDGTIIGMLALVLHVVTRSKQRKRLQVTPVPILGGVCMTMFTQQCFKRFNLSDTVSWIASAVIGGGLTVYLTLQESEKQDKSGEFSPTTVAWVFFIGVIAVGLAAVFMKMQTSKAIEAVRKLNSRVITLDQNIRTMEMDIANKEKISNGILNDHSNKLNALFHGVMTVNHHAHLWGDAEGIKNRVFSIVTGGGFSGVSWRDWL